MSLQYNSNHNVKNFEKQYRFWDAKPEDELYATETFRVLSPFVDFRGWGTLRQAWNEAKPRPKPVITKRIKAALREWDNTPVNPETGYRFPVYFRDDDGNETDDRFNFYIHYQNRLWSPKQIQKCFDDDQRMYYTSSRSRLRMAYLDGDSHQDWQVTHDVVRLLQKLFGNIPFFRSSPRGYNGWVKVICPDTDKWNKSLKRLESALKKLRYQHRCTCDIEVKGGTNTKQKNADLAKLPCWNWVYPYLKRDDDDCWNFRRLKEFERKPILTWPQWQTLIKRIESQIDEAEVAQGKSDIEQLEKQYEEEEVKKSLPISSKPIRKAKPASPPKVTPLPVAEGQALGKRSPVATDLCSVSSRVVSAGCPDSIREIDDAWKRDLRFTCWLARQLKKVPTAEEALAADQVHHIYRGRWEDGLDERRRRYEEHVSYVAQNFDKSLCGSGKSTRSQLDEKIREWRGRAHLLSKKLTVVTGTTKTLDEKMCVVVLSGRKAHVKRDHVLRLAGIIHHVSCSHEDHGIPRDSIEGWWRELAEEGVLPNWSKDYYYACRAVLVQNGWLKINHEYVQGVKAKTAVIEHEPELVGTKWSYPEEERSNNYSSHTTTCNSGVAIDCVNSGGLGSETTNLAFRGPP